MITGNKLSELNLTDAEAAYIEARRNCLLQKDGDLSQVMRGRRPDACGQYTEMVGLTVRQEYTIPASADGALVQCTLPLSGAGSGADIGASFKNGGSYIIPTVGDTYQNATFVMAPWDDVATFQAKAVTRGSTAYQSPYRVIGWNGVVNSKNADDATTGDIDYAQLDYTVPACTDTTGAWVTGNCGTGTVAATYVQVKDEMVTFNSQPRKMSAGCTGRVIFRNPKVWGNFVRASALPFYKAGAAVGSFDSSQWPNHYDSGPERYNASGRQAIPTFMLRGLTAGDKISIQFNLLLEVLPVRGGIHYASALSPYSPRLDFLDFICSDPSVYADEVDGHSLWPTTKRVISKAANGAITTVWKLALPRLKDVARQQLEQGLEAWAL